MEGFDFEQLFETSPNAYMVLDRELRYVAVNQAYLRAVSGRREDLLGKKALELFPDEPGGAPSPSKRLLSASYARVLATGAPDVIALVPYRMPRIQPDGSLRDEDRYWSATNSPLFDSQGAVKFIVQHAVEVTELHELRNAKRAPDELEQGVLGRARQVQAANALLSQERGLLRSLFQQAPGFVAFLRGRDHVFELVNAAYHQLVGHREIVGKAVREALPEVVGQGFVELLDSVYLTGTPFSGRDVRVLLQRTKDAELEESFLDFVYQPIRGGDGEVAGIFVQGNDITAQKRTEAERSALLASERAARARAETAEREHRFLAEAIPQQVWTALPNGQLDFVNDRVVNYFGTTREQVLGEGWQNVIHPDDLPGCIAAWTHSLTTGTPYEIEFRLRRADGSYRWHLGRASPLHLEGVVSHWYGTNTDIDEARRSRDELQARTTFEQQLIGIVSHDLRNPVNAIGMSASLLLKRGNLDDKQGRALGRIVSSVERASRLIRDFLDFTRARSVARFPIEPKASNLREITQQVVDEVHLSWPERQVSVAHDGAEEGRWDTDRIAQVIGNLVANAFQHSPPEVAVRVASRIDGDAAAIEVHNEGPPIADEDKKLLFSPFQRGEGARRFSSARSVGLGLYIAHSIVTAHGGQIEVDSADGRGTRFTVRLPREARP